MRRFLWIVAVLAVCTSGTFAQDVSMTLTSVTGDGIMGGVYTSPYSITVGTTPMLLICDDFTYNIPTIPYSWTAQTTSLTSLQGETTPSTSVKFGETITQPTPPSGLPGTCTSGDSACAKQQVLDYATAAVLAAQLMALGNYDSEEAGDLSYAIWGIFDPSLLTSNPASGEGALSKSGYVVPGIDGGDLGAAEYYLSQAQSIVNANALAHGGTVDLSLLPELTIYTPVGSPDSQEFLGVSMAEPSYLSTLVFDLLGVGVLFVAFRRRLSRTLS